MPKANIFGSIGNTYKHGKGASKIALDLVKKYPNKLELSDVAFEDNKFIFKVKGRKLMTITANNSIKRKIVAKVCAPIPVPENP